MKDLEKYLPRQRNKKNDKLSARIIASNLRPLWRLPLKANALRTEGWDVIGFGAGEPDSIRRITKKGGYSGD